MEKKLKTYLYLVITLLIISFPLWSSNENKIKLPEKKQHAKSDSNNNGIRDEIEHYIFEKVTKDSVQYGLYLRYALENEKMLLNVNNLKEAKKNQIMASSIQDCLSKKNDPFRVSDNLIAIGFLVTNTKDKSNIKSKIINENGFPTSDEIKREGVACPF